MSIIAMIYEQPADEGVEPSPRQKALIDEYESRGWWLQEVGGTASAPLILLCKKGAPRMMLLDRDGKLIRIMRPSDCRSED